MLRLVCDSGTKYEDQAFTGFFKGLAVATGAISFCDDVKNRSTLILCVSVSSAFSTGIFIDSSMDVLLLTSCLACWRWEDPAGSLRAAGLGFTGWACLIRSWISCTVLWCTYSWVPSPIGGLESINFSDFDFRSLHVL